MLTQELESLLHNHPEQQKTQIEGLVQSLVNNHVMVAAVQTDLDEYQARYAKSTAGVSTKWVLGTVKLNAT